MKKALLLLTMCLWALSNAFGAVTVYLQEDFESGQIPTSWTQQVVSTNEASWVIESRSASTQPDSVGNMSNYHVALRNTTGMDKHYVTRLISPAINFASASYVYQPILVFNHAQPGYLNDVDTLKLYYRPNATSEWTLLKVFQGRIDNWTMDTVTLMGYAGATAYQLAFESVENMGWGIVLDDISVLNKSTCQPTSDVAVSVPGTTSATLTWAGDQAADSFEVVVSATAITDWSASYTAAFHGFSTDFSIEVTGLTPSTTYFAYVRSSCSDNETGWTNWAEGTFITRARIDLPYVENFSSSMPYGWVAKSDLTGKPAFSSATASASTLAGYSVDSTFAMQFSSITAGKYACAITPQVNVPSLQGVEVGFWGYANTYYETPLNSYIAKMYVGVVNDPEDVESLVIVDSVEIKVASKHQHFTVSFENYTGTGKYLVFLVSDPKRSAYFYLDHVTVDQPAVLTPTDVQIVNAGPDGFDVKVNLHGASQWNLRVADAANYKHMNVLPSSFLLSQDGITGNTYHVAGSYGDQIVAVYAQAVSGTNTSAWSFPTTLRIPARATLPLAYEFDNTTDASVLVRSLDNEIHLTSNTNKTFPRMYFPLLDLANFFPKLVTTAPKYENTSHMLLQGQDQWIALPYVESFSGQMVSFRLAAATEGQSRVAVGIMRDAYDLSTFTKLAEFNGPLNAYRKCEVDLDGLDSLGHYVAIVAIRPATPSSSYGSVNHIDALHVEAIPGCPEALDINAVVADTAISLTWATRGMSHWLVELFAGSNPDSLIASKDVNTPEVMFGGLTSLTDYYYRVNTWCGNDTLRGNGKIKFTTKCDLISTFPWSENFDNMATGTIAESCWDNVHTAGSATTKFTVSSTSTGGNTTRKLYLGTMAAGNLVRLSLPEMILPNNNYEFVISMYRNSLTPAKTAEGLRIFASDGENETELAYIPRLITEESTEVSAEVLDGWYTYHLTIPMSGLCRIIIQGESESGTAIYADDLMVREIPSCPIMGRLKVSNITASSATASWTPRGNENQWQYVLTVPGQATDWSSATIVGTPSVQLTGLNGSTTYTFNVRAYCGASEQGEVVSKSFNTACGPITSMPWGEGFEAHAVGSYSDMSLPCWSALNAATTSSTYPQVYVYNSATYVKTGTKSLYFKSSKDNYIYTVFPVISLPLNTLKIAFSHREENASSSGKLGIGYMTDPTDASTFVLLSEFTRLVGWQDEELILSGIPAEVATTARLAFRYGGSTSNNYYVGVDDIMLTEVDFSCPGLSEVTATTSSPSSISIAWTAEAMLPVNIEVSDSANFSVVRTYAGVETSPLVLDSLEQNHRYYVRARQVCDAGGEWKSTVVKTLCNPVVPAEYPVQTFEGANDLDCWLVGVSVPGKQTTADPSIGNLAARGHYLYFNKAATSSDTITKGDGLYAIMPMMDVDSIKGYEVGFNAFKTSTSAGNAGKLTVGVVTDPSDFSTFTAIQNMKLDYAADSLSEKEYTVNFLNYQGDYNGDFGKYIVFYAQSGDSLNQIGVDNVEVRTVASCPRVNEGLITDTVSNGATYRWNGTGAPAYEVVLLTERMDPDSAFTEVAFRDTVSTDSIVIRGISPATMYYAYVRGLCNDNDVSRWSTYTRFRTSCGAATIPYAENFDDTEALQCFTVGNMQNTAASYIPSLQTSTSYLYNSQQSLKMYAYKYSTTTNADSAYVILPEMDYGTKGLKAHTLSFYGRSYSLSSSTTSDYCKKLKVGVVSGEDMKTFQLVKELTLTDLFTLQEVSFDEYTGNGNRIALLAAVNMSSTLSYKYCYAYLDDILVYKTPTCKSIASLKANAGRRTIDVTIVPKDNGTPDHYDLVYSTTELSAAELEAAAKISVDTTGLYTIRGLDRETQYYLYARSNCGAEEGTSEWTALPVKTKALIGEEVIMIAEGTTTNSYAPVYGTWTDHPQRVQSIYPAELLTSLIGKPISKLTYYMTAASTKAGGSWRTGMGSFQVGVAITQQTAATTTYANDPLMNIHTGSLDASGTEMTIELATPLVYTGGNLLVDFLLPEATIYEAATFYGMTQTGGSCYAYDHTTKNPTVSAFLPMIGCTYRFEVDSCPAVTDLTTELLGLGVSEAMVRWDASEDDYLSGCDVIISDSVVANPDSVAPTYANVQGDSLHVTGLNPETLYYVYVRAICKAEGHDEGNSVWTSTTFETLANCPAVIDLTSELSTAATTAKVSWSTVFEDQALNFAYVYSLDSLDKAGLAAAEKHYVNDTTVCEISGLNYDQTYHIYVASVCGTSLSPWTETVIKTEPSCAPVRNLTATRIEHNRVVLNWNRSRFGSETQWEAGIVGDSASVVIVSDSSAMLIGLTDETQYIAYVRALCGDGEVSEIDTLSFTTGVFSECVTVGNGTTSGYYVPLANYYKNAWTQSIYTAEQIGGAGQITAIQYQVAAVPTTAHTQEVTIYMAHTSMDLASTTSSWVPQGDLVEVYSNTAFVHPTETGWVEITLSSPFTYNGSDNLAIVASTHASAYSTALKYAYTAGTSGVSLYRGSDSDASYGNYPGTSTGSKSTNLPNTQFCFASTGGCRPVTALTVGDITTSTAVASWEPMGTERSWEVYVADTTITDFTGLRIDTAYHYVYPMGNLQDDKDYWFYVRPVCGGDWKAQKFTTVAACSAPVELDYDSVTCEHALVSWNDAFSVGQSYIVAYGLADSIDLTDPSTYQTKTVQTPYAWIDGLEEVTMYAFAVQSVCEGGLVSRFSEIATFQTPCAVKPLGWSDSFENEVYCWYVGNRTNSSSSYIPGIISSANTASNAQYVRTGVRAFKMYAYKYSTSTNADSAYVIVPEIDYGSAGIQGAAIRFYARSSGTSTSSSTDYYKHVEIGVIKNRNIRTYEKVKDVTITNQYDMYEVSFANYVGEGDRIVFLATVNPNTSASTRYCNVYFDDFEVIEAPTCWRPETVTVVSTVADSASFTWTPGASETQWQYTYTPFGMVPDWTNAVLTDTTIATVAGLSASTTYDFHVRSYCSATDQSIYRSATFKSAECGVVTELPWKEGFEAYTAGTYSATAATYVPACWDMAKSTVSGSAYPHVAASGSYAYPHSGEKVLVTYDKDTCYAVMPAFAAALNDLQVTFFYRTYNVANCGYLVLGYVTADQTFHEIQHFDPIATVTKAKVLLNNLPDSLDARLAFMYTGGGSYAYYNVSIDDITVDYINYNCAGVNDVRVSNFGLTNATIAWGYTLGNHDAQVQIASDAAFEEIVDSALVMNDSIYTSTVLNSGTKYYVRVRQACEDDEFSDWADPIDFVTSYGLPFIPRFTSTTVPSGWMRSNTEASQVFAGTSMATETSGWLMIAADTLINSYHFRGNIFGTTWHHWVVTPAIDMSPNLGDGILLSFDAALTPYGTGTTRDNNMQKMYTCVDDRFLVAVSTDGGNTWNPADVVEWNNSGTGQYVYNDVPMDATMRYMINMSNYAGSNVKIGFYGESTISNADNWFQFGNIRLETVATTTLVDTICEGYSFSKNGFTVPYEDLQPGLNVVSRYEMNADSTMSLTVQQIWVMAASVTEIPVTLCEGEHYNGYGFDFTASVSENIRRRVEGGNQYGCDSTVILQVTVNPVITAEKNIAVNAESYTLNGKTYYQSTVVMDTTASAVTGCDSITTIYLTFCEQTVLRYHNAFCAGGSYSDEFFENLTAPGVYTGSRTDEIGCVTNAELTLHLLLSGQDYTDSVHVSNLPYVLGNDTLCPETDQAGFVYHGSKDFGCGMVNVTIYVYDKVALNNIVAGTLQVAPNPVRIGEDIKILTSVDLSSDYSCRVFDAVGKLVYETDEPATTIPGLPAAGAYTVRISSGTAVYQAKLIVK